MNDFIIRSLCFELVNVVLVAAMVVFFYTTTTDILTSIYFICFVNLRLINLFLTFNVNLYNFYPGLYYTFFNMVTIILNMTYISIEIFNLYFRAIDKFFVYTNINYMHLTVLFISLLSILNTIFQNILIYRWQDINMGKNFNIQYSPINPEIKA